MTVLRSQEIVPTIKSQFPLETLKEGIIEPATPAKSTEPSTNTVYSTPGSSTSLRSATPIGLGSDSVSVLGSARRRSLRLASGLSAGEITPSVTVSNQKRKSVVAENWMKPKNEYGLENVGRDNVGIMENGVSDFQVTKVRVSDRIRIKNRVRGELGMDEEKVETGERNLYSSTSVSMVDVVTEGRCVSNFGSPSDLRSFTQDSRRVLSDRKEKGKIKSGKDDLLAFELVREGSNKGFLNLRSGMKISKRRMEGNSDDVDFVRFESDDGDKSVHVNGGGDEDKASERVLNGEIGKGFLMKNTTRDSGGDEIATTPEGRSRLTGALIEGIDLVVTEELYLGCNLEMSSGNAVSDIVHLPGNLGLKELDKGQMSDEICSGGKARMRLSRVEKGKGKVVEDELLSNGNAVSDTVYLLEKVGLKELEKDPMTENRAVKARRSRRLSREEKGKGKAVEDGLLSNGIDVMELDLELKLGNSTKKAVSSTLSLADDVSVEDERQVVGTNTRANVMKGRDYKERFRDIAKQNASRFAHFSSQEVEENHVTNEAESEMPRREVDREMEDWPGPFSTAMKIIKDRQMNVNVPQQNSCADKSKGAPVIWVPKKDQHHDCSKQSIPQLQDLCLAILAKNADAITSLESVPDVLRHKLSQLLCDSRRMNSHFLGLLVQGSPTEIRIRDCSWLTEEQFTRTFQGCEASNLVVLQLDQCGRCMPDYVLSATLARFPNNLPALTAISLKGACRLSDVGLSALITSAPALRSINLSQCSLLTSDGVNTLADSMGSVLRELYIDDCENIDAMLILPALSKLEHLEVLSVVGIRTVCDDFVSKFITARGHTIKELVLTDCMKLTDSSLKVIAETCNGLRAIDLGNLCRLTDSTMGYLANGCRAIQTLKLCRNLFSDEAVAAFLEASGESLKELSLNNVHKVGHNTAISLAIHSSKLLNLDLSWCRNLTNEALGLIVDGCLSLKVLKLFGCTQITNVFLDGHSNPQVQIIGLKMTPILEHLKVPDPLEGPLHYSAASS